MKKKYYRYILLILVILIMVPILISRFRDSNKHLPAHKANTAQEIRQYYYSSVPGLKRAEQNHLIKPIHKSFDIPDIESILKIDRIWFNSRETYIFYHVENMEDIIYLGGSFADNEKEKIFELDPGGIEDSSGNKGVFYNENFYSFCKTPAVDIDCEVIEDNFLYFTPSILIKGVKKSFKPIAINLEKVILDEPIETFELDMLAKLGDHHINIYELESGVSYNKLYFTYTGPEDGLIYKLNAHVFANNGEGLAVRNNPTIINREEGKYCVELEPFNEFPESLRIQFKSMSFIGKDLVRGIIDTQEVEKAYEEKDVKNVDISLGELLGVDIVLANVFFEDDETKIQLLYNNPKDKENSISLETGNAFNANQRKLLFNVNDDNMIIPNIFSIQNSFGQTIEDYGQGYPHISSDGSNRINLVLPLEYWNKSEKIYISISNITYRLNLNQTVEGGLIDK